MKEKFLIALKTKFDGVQDAILSRVADKLSKTTTDETQVQTVVDGVTTQQILESYGDARATEAVATHKKSQTKKPEPDKGADKQDDTEETEIAKLMKAVAELSNQVSQQQQKTQQQSYREKLGAKLKDKVPEKHISKLLGNRTIEKDEDIETLATELEATWGELKQEFTNDQVPPGPGGGGVKPAALAGDLEKWRKDKGLPEKPEIKKT